MYGPIVNADPMQGRIKVPMRDIYDRHLCKNS